MLLSMIIQNGSVDFWKLQAYVCKYHEKNTLWVCNLKKFKGKKIRGSNSDNLFTEIKRRVSSMKKVIKKYMCQLVTLYMTI